MLKTNTSPEMDLLGVNSLQIRLRCASIELSQQPPTIVVLGPAGSCQPDPPTPGQSGPAGSAPRPP